MEKQVTSDLSSRSPIVAVLGHVDHGKTTLLDTIRKANITQSEAGGITQHIGAYQVTVNPKDKPLSRASETSRGISSKQANSNSQMILRQAQDDFAFSGRKITFIDTPGHEAFTKMRGRGVAAADMCLLVVSATDGVMPQTIESIKQIKNAAVPFIVVVNKIDLPDADIDKVKQQLASSEVLIEGYGGDVVLVPLSAKTGQGIPELLELITLLAELKEIQADRGGKLEGVVIESKLDTRRGSVATLIIKNGTLKKGDVIYAEEVKAKVKALVNDRGDAIEEALPGTPVEVLGWEKLPPIGAGVYNQIQVESVSPESKFMPKAFALPPISEIKKLKLILKADAAGSLEAIKENIGKEEIEIVSSATGEITESDVLLAKSTGAAIIGFHLKISSSVAQLAALEKVRIKTYSIIYELLTEIQEVTQLLNQPQAQEEVLGKATILAEFKAGDDRVAGCKITEGRVVRNDLVKLVRLETEVDRGRVKSLRHGKEDIPKAETAKECGIVFDKKLDFKMNDTIIAYKVRELLA